VLLCKTSLYHCNYTYEDLFFIQVCSDPTPVHCNTVQGKMLSPLLTAALQDRLAAGLYHCNYTYEDWLFIKCAVTQHQCTATLFRAKCCPHCSLLLCKTSLYHCNYTYEDLFFIQVCSDPTPAHCNTVQGKIQSPLLRAALQDRLAAGLCHCNYTCGDLLFTQVCSDPTPMHCNTAFGKMKPPLLSAALQNSRFVSVQLHPWRLALHTGVQ